MEDDTRADLWPQLEYTHMYLYTHMHMRVHIHMHTHTRLQWSLYRCCIPISLDK